MFSWVNEKISFDEQSTSQIVSHLMYHSAISADQMYYFLQNGLPLSHMTPNRQFMSQPHMLQPSQFMLQPTWTPMAKPKRKRKYINCTSCGKSKRSDTLKAHELKCAAKSNKIGNN